ncbi:pirin family protein [Pseudenhygromyxa sp. WMMC2535]|uniref:pirin family protein n=1 Tax=Pseudenhygromyxa sp. WMMC2535 TaxID=2712867 RepID=UPI001552F49F|nr:pirin family protein [Pseudenhygromyxa sp. WMMC2535]NVB39473.1 pirin family protein [Pseudenhygromyxa sp. WMMC2535]
MTSPVLAAFELGFAWPAFDPFLFCVHHEDHYPAGTDTLGPPPASLAGRNIGMDFEPQEGWRMYHGDVVPGFPRHPHRGFETVTLMRRGYVDHSDSLGATARFGQGDVQWMTAGAGIVHCEMFPLLEAEAPNPAELFQLWLNLPARNKMVEPHFAMLWSDTVPKLELEGGAVRVTVVAGALEGAKPPAPPPKSWAAEPDADVAIWSIELAPGARWTLPPAQPGSNRTLYFFAGESLQVGDQVAPPCGMRLRPDQPLPLVNGAKKAELLLLQGKPIAEPVAQRGPFVMNTQAELQQAMVDYRRTHFGGWPWKRDDPVHPREAGRFAIHADGRREER